MLRDPLVRWLALIYGAVWVIAAISPLDRGDWLLENLLVIAFVPVLPLTYARFQFSRTSYVLIFLFLVMHAYAAHYTYSLTPFCFWLQGQLGETRNHFDRIVHFGFGLLLTFPLREVGVRVLGLRSGWSYAVPALVILGISGAYEIVAEGHAARAGGLARVARAQRRGRRGTSAGTDFMTSA